MRVVLDRLIYLALESYSTSQEILGYFKDIVNAHRMHQYVKLSHSVAGAWWDEETGKWKIKIEPNCGTQEPYFDEGEILINATGVLKYVLLFPLNSLCSSIILATGSGLKFRE